jgi:2-methylisocitrate lyase-like PEP mutase family enzyme
MRLRKSVVQGKASTGFRRLLTEGPWPVVGMWGATAHHAQLTEATGFKYFGISGSHTASHLFGLPDAGFMTLPEIVENTRRICQAVSIPVIVDCDTGFGNAINVVRTVDEIIRAGAAGLFIEDQVSPKRCGFVKGKELISLEDAVSKYRAACETRDGLDPDVIIQARTDARGAVGGGMDEVLRRCEAYLRAGVDSLYVEALQSVQEIRTVREAFPDALLKATPYAIDPPITAAEVQELRLCMTGPQIHKIGAVAMYDFLVEYAQRGEPVFTEWSARTKKHPLGGFGMFDLTGFPAVLDMEQKYLSAEALERYEQSIGVYDPRARDSTLSDKDEPKGS